MIMKIDDYANENELVNDVIASLHLQYILYMYIKFW